jgi:hypothetical protein
VYESHVVMMESVRETMKECRLYRVEVKRLVRQCKDCARSCGLVLVRMWYVVNESVVLS